MENIFRSYRVTREWQVHPGVVAFVGSSFFLFFFRNNPVVKSKSNVAWGNVQKLFKNVFPFLVFSLLSVYFKIQKDIGIIRKHSRNEMKNIENDFSW